MELDIYNWLLVFLRVGAFLLVLPFFSAVNFPVQMRVALAALMALRTGLRVGELLALDWGDIDLDKRIMTVRHSVRRGRECC